MRRATDEELQRWDRMVVANPDGGHILQSRTWGEFKAGHHWAPRHFVYDAGGQDVAVLFLARRFVGFGELWYAPKGPGVASLEQLRAIVDATARARPAFLVKWEPELREDDADLGALPGAPLRHALSDIQASKATVIVDLRPSEDDILASFKPKTRYNVRLAERRGVKVSAVASDEPNLATMCALLMSAHGRAGILIRRREYYIDSWRRHSERGVGQLFLATVDGEAVAGAFVTFLGTKAWYKDGGSVREQRASHAPHLLQWEVMRWLRSRGVTSYDLVGVPPPNQMSPDHVLFGLVQFKSGFSPDVVEFVGTWDQRLGQRRYSAWASLGERAHTWVSQRLRHEPLF